VVKQQPRGIIVELYLSYIQAVAPMLYLILLSSIKRSTMQDHRLPIAQNIHKGKKTDRQRRGALFPKPSSLIPLSSQTQNSRTNPDPRGQGSTPPPP
jgi:hypothetical protein